jgi:HEAT repeat protein
MKVQGFSTRRFPVWLQAFNVLCAVTALAIVGFGAWHLLGSKRAPALEGLIVGQGDAATIDTTVLAQRLLTPQGGVEVGTALLDAPEAEARRVLDVASGSCLAGGLALGAELAGRPDAVGLEAAADVTAALGLDPKAPPPTEDLRQRVHTFVTALDPHDVALLLAARAIVQDPPHRRDRAIERLVQLHDGRGIPALLAALGTPEPERSTRVLAQAALATFAGDGVPVVNDGTSEERWREWWRAHESTYLKPPYSLQQNAEMLVSRLARAEGSQKRDVIRALGIMKVGSATTEILHQLVAAEDPLTRAMAAWTLGRLGAGSAVEPLALALKDKDPLVRIAAARAIGRARFLPVKADVEKLLEDKDSSVRRGAALALVGFFDRQGLPEIDVVAFDAHVPAAERVSVLEELDEAGDGLAASSRWIAALSDPVDSVRLAARAALARRVSADEVFVGRAAWTRWWADRYSGTGVSIPIEAGN